MTVGFDSSLLIALAGAVQIGMSESQDNADWPAYPGDDPTTTELKKWLDAWHKSLKGTEANSLLLGQTPQSLISISSGTDVSDLREITCRDPSKESASEMAARMKHNVTVRNALKKEKDRKAQYEAGIRSIQDGFAGRLAKSMLRTAPNRLKAHERAHIIAGTGDKMHNGIDMFKAIEAMQTTPGPMELEVA